MATKIKSSLKTQEKFLNSDPKDYTKYPNTFLPPISSVIKQVLKTARGILNKDNNGN